MSPLQSSDQTATIVWARFIYALEWGEQWVCVWRELPCVKQVEWLTWHGHLCESRRGNDLRAFSLWTIGAVSQLYWIWEMSSVWNRDEVWACPVCRRVHLVGRSSTIVLIWAWILSFSLLAKEVRLLQCKKRSSKCSIICEEHMARRAWHHLWLKHKWNIFSYFHSSLLQEGQ